MSSFLSTILTILSFAFFACLILSIFNPKLLTKKLPPEKQNRKYAFLITGVVFIIAIICSNLYTASLTPEEKAAVQQKQKADQANFGFKNNKFVKALELDNLNQAKDIENFLTTLEIKDVDSISHDENLDEPSGIKGYRLKVKNLDSDVFLYLNPNKTVQAVRCNAQNLYKDGVTYNKLSDVNLTIDQQSQMQIAVEKAVKSILKAPKTAEFSDFSEYQYSIQNGIGTISGYVDSQNGFGVLIRSNFSAQFDMKAGKMIHLIFDGKTIF